MAGGAGTSKLDRNRLKVGALRTGRVRLKPPPELLGAARRYFIEIVKQAPDDHFLPVDLTPLMTYCRALASADKAASELDAEGEVYYDQNGNPKASPWVGILQKANTAIASFSVKLRLTPSSRQNIREIKEAAKTAARREASDLTDATQHDPMAEFLYSEPPGGSGSVN